ncbi:hypothetical protein [Actinomadura craniellae]|uniref:hypothetical protein n=1 Tax=Actinomadura craniellae TaxID=2231787 RepID=UPI0011BF6E8B|nr:hypothetical protein [Actinomadura craniellae]
MAMAALLTACASDSPSGGTFQPTGRYGGEAAPTGPSAPPGPGTLPVSQVEAQVLARYREYHKAYKNAYETGDPSSLTTVAMDPLLTSVTKDVERTHAKGEIWRFTNVLNPRVKGRSKDNSLVIVIDCVRTLGTHRFSTRTGKRLGSYPGGTNIQESLMKYAGGTWTISDTKLGKRC